MIEKNIIIIDEKVRVRLTDNNRVALFHEDQAWPNVFSYDPSTDILTTNNEEFSNFFKTIYRKTHPVLAFFIALLNVLTLGSAVLFTISALFTTGLVFLILMFLLFSFASGAVWFFIFMVFMTWMLNLSKKTEKKEMVHSFHQLIFNMLDESEQVNSMDFQNNQHHQRQPHQLTC